MAYFPMFLDIKDKKCLIIGGGEIAYRKLCILHEFGADITLIAEDIDEKIYDFKDITILKQSYHENYLKSNVVVIAATNNNELNHEIAESCRQQGILVNAVDMKADCDFIFPSYIKKDEIVAAFSSSGLSPIITQYLKEQNETIITEELVSTAKLLGSLRPIVKKRILSYQLKKKLYNELFSKALIQELTENDIEEIIAAYEKQDTNN